MDKKKNFYFIFEDPTKEFTLEAEEGYTFFYIVDKEYFYDNALISDWHNQEEVLESIPEEMRDAFEDDFEEVSESIYMTTKTSDEIREYFSYLKCFEETTF